MTALVFAVGASFLASCVEWVEAFTIILAVGITRGWKSALYGAAVAAIVLAGIIAIFGLTLTSLPKAALQLVIGALVLVFGLKWLRKAILRYAGIKGKHDEAEIFAEQTAELQGMQRAAGLDWGGFTVSFQGTLLEGLEVVFIVITFGLNSGQMPLTILGAVGAFVVVALTGVFVRRPLQQVPENTMKFVVGLMLTTFGTFWAGEGLGVDWGQLADLWILPLLGIYLLFSWIAARLLRSARAASLAAAGQANTPAPAS
ncbi:MAG TPA: hypothetical protein VKU60_03850 [Chloroflexota bacterium]|nr:hypothetical protein [Chloroflexota bacterium]